MKPTFYKDPFFYLGILILLAVSSTSYWAITERSSQCREAARYALSWNALTDYLLDETERTHRAPSVMDVQAAEYAREQMVEASKGCVGR